MSSTNAAAAGAESSGERPAADLVLPEIPAARADLAHLVIPGTVIWFAAFLVLLIFAGRLREHGTLIYLWTSLAGWILGLIGLAIYFWQRSAARRGRRSANQMALEETL